jgi:hypothetical protein
MSVVESVVPCPGRFKSFHYLFPGDAKVKVNSLNDLYPEQLQGLAWRGTAIDQSFAEDGEGTFLGRTAWSFRGASRETKEHARRIKTIFEGMGEKAKAPKCKAMEGLVKEGSAVIGRGHGR